MAGIEISQAPEQTTIEDTDWYIIAVPPYRQAGSNRKISGANIKLAIDDARVYIQDEGGTPFAFRKYINFIGAAVTATDNPGQNRVDVTVNAIVPPGQLAVQEEGVVVNAATEFINFIGGSVTATLNGVGVDVTLSPTNVARTAYVDLAYGSDVTGLIEDFDKPFATPQAAIDALSTLLTPTENNRALVVLRPGLYTTGIICKNFVDIEFQDATFNVPYVPNVVKAAIMDSAVATYWIGADTRIYGKGKIITDSGSAGSGIWISGLDTKMTITGIDIETYSVCISVLGMPYVKYSGGNLESENSYCFNVNTNPGAEIHIEDSTVTTFGSGQAIGLAANATCYVKNCRVYTDDAGGSSAAISVRAGVSASTLVLQSVSLVCPNTTYSIIEWTSTPGANVNCYGGCASTKPVSGDVTLLVGTVANNGFIVDANVI